MPLVSLERPAKATFSPLIDGLTPWPNPKLLNVPVPPGTGVLTSAMLISEPSRYIQMLPVAMAAAPNATFRPLIEGLPPSEPRNPKCPEVPGMGVLVSAITRSLPSM